MNVARATYTCTRKDNNRLHVHSWLMFTVPGISQPPGLIPIIFDKKSDENIGI